MTGGSITNNEAGDFGGGVFVSHGETSSFSVGSGCTVTGNTAASGGNDVYVCKDAMYTNNGATLGTEQDDVVIVQ